MVFKFTTKQHRVIVVDVSVLRNSVLRSQMSSARRATAVRRTIMKSASAMHNRLPSVCLTYITQRRGTEPVS